MKRLGWMAAIALMMGAAGAEAATPAPGAAPDNTDLSKDLDAFLADAMGRLETVPALSVSVATSDGPLYVKTFGEANIERGLPATPHTRFYIASSTKSFVALALALLDAKGTIDLDWTLAELAPDIDFAPELRADEVTLRHLLSHSHGLTGDPITFRLAYSGEHDPELLWGLLARLRPNDEAPLGQFDYGNIGYNIATLLVEHKLGRRWQEIAESEVLRPLGMDETLTRGLKAARANHAFAAPYKGFAPGGPERLYLVKADNTMQSAGGMYSTASDMARWVQLQLNSHRGGGRAIDPRVVAATHTPIVAVDTEFGPYVRTGYGLGWYSGDYLGQVLYHSFGSFPGARAHVSFVPGLDIGVAALSNDAGIGFKLVDVVAAYVYDHAARGQAFADAQAGQAITRLDAFENAAPAKLAAGRAERAARPWLLTLPLQAYAGSYCSSDYGTLTVSLEGEGLTVKIGRLHALAQAFTEPESIRVELVPNSGRMLQFVIEGGQAIAVHGLDGTFARCGEKAG